jgi:hypothetical protein
MKNGGIGMFIRQDADTTSEDLPMALKLLRLRRIDVLGAAILSAVASAVAGLIMGILYLVSALYVSSMLSQIPLIGNQAAAAWTAWGVYGLVLSPIIFAILGFVVGLLASVCVNVALGSMGGLKVNVDLDTDLSLENVPGEQ